MVAKRVLVPHKRPLLAPYRSRDDLRPVIHVIALALRANNSFIAGELASAYTLQLWCFSMSRLDFPELVTAPALEAAPRPTIPRKPMDESHQSLAVAAVKAQEPTSTCHCAEPQSLILKGLN